MDRENDNNPGGPERSNASPTEGAVEPVAPPRPAVPATYRALNSAISPEPGSTAQLVRDNPSLMVASSELSFDARPLVESPVLKPSVAATLPPPQIAVLPATSPQLRDALPSASQISDTRLMLAPEAHLPSSMSMSFGLDPVAPSPNPDRAYSSKSDTGEISTTLSSAVADRKVDFIPQSISSPTRPRIEPVFGPSTAVTDAAAVAIKADGPPVQSAPNRALDYVKKAAKYAAYAVVAYFALIAFLILSYRFVNPPMSSLMLQQWISGQAIYQSWASIDEISPQVVRAVLLSEDGRFCDHTGVDFDAMQDAIERAGDGAPRGASTISMQVVKNLFLWPSKSYVRKAIEIPITWAMELAWPKSRIMEIYLNIAEWGPGIFGVESAAQFHFQKSARRLNEREAAQLAVSLPNPYMRDAGDPGPKTRRLASDIQSRMRNAYPSQISCVIRAGARR